MVERGVVMVFFYLFFIFLNVYFVVKLFKPVIHIYCILKIALPYFVVFVSRLTKEKIKLAFKNNVYAFKFKMFDRFKNKNKFQ